MRTLLLLIALVVGVSAQCSTFYSGLCPGGSSCMCTSGGSCGSVDSNITALAKAGGSCPGKCVTVEFGKCPGGSNCLLDTGVGCGGGGGGGCLQPCGSPCACCGIPSNNQYFLTSFDGTSCSCGACHSKGEYFCADRQRFGCGSYLTVCRGLSCIKVVVIDYGPSCFVENDAGGPVLDASPAVCQKLTGGSSCGWSDHFAITVTRALSPEEDGIPTGPLNVTSVEGFKTLMEIGRKLEVLAAGNGATTNHP